MVAGVFLSIKTTHSVLSSHLASVSPLKCLDGWWFIALQWGRGEHEEMPRGQKTFQAPGLKTNANPQALKSQAE